MRYVLCLLALTVGLSACSKKAPTPGQKQTPPAPAANTRPEQGKAPIPSNRDNEHPLRGSYESECTRESHDANPDSGVVDLYESYRSVVTVEDSKITEKYYHFKGTSCANYVYSIKAQDDNVWGYAVDKVGAVDGADWFVMYLEFNADLIDVPGGIRITSQEVDGRIVDTLKFLDDDGSIWTYTRAQ